MFVYCVDEAYDSQSRGMAQTVCRRSVTAGAGFDPRSVSVRFAVDKVPVSQVSLTVLLFPPYNIIPPMLIIPPFLTTSFHQCSVVILKLILLLSEGQAGEV
jgi:hypothetical protein